MRFRAVMTDASYMKKFTEVLQALANLSKACVLRVCNDKFFFIVMESQQPQVWWELDSDQFFGEYTMRGVSESQNEFYLEFGPEMLAQTLVSLKKPQAPRSVKIKLTQKSGPCLRFEMELQSPVSLVRICSHDFPVSIIPRSQWGSIHAADEYDYDVCLELPDLRDVYQWLECFKSLGPYCYLIASPDGHFQVKIVHELATCIKQLSGLRVDTEASRANTESGIHKLLGVRIDRRKLLAFLNLVHSFPPDSVIRCDLANRKLAHLQLIRNDAALHFFCRHVLEDVVIRHSILDTTLV